MSASSTDPIIPPWAVTTWVDDSKVYIALPMTNGGHYIQSFEKSDMGLGKALSIMHAAFSGVKKTNGGQAVVFDVVTANKDKVVRPKDKFSKEQMEKTRAVLRKAGVIK